MNTKNNNILSIDDISLNFGRVNALVNFNMEVFRKGVTAIIGPNGAGKTSLLNCISGFYHPQKGKILLDGENITNIPAWKRASLGIGRTFQNIELFDGLSVMENILIGRHCVMKDGLVSSSFYFGRARRIEIEHRKAVENIIDFLEIQAIRDKPAQFLTYGQRKKVDLARALALQPKLLLLDEPMAGMNLDEKEDIARYIIDIVDVFHVPVIIIEHDMEVVMDISENITVLEFGRNIAFGNPEEIKNNPLVIEAYLGTDTLDVKKGI